MTEPTLRELIDDIENDLMNRIDAILPPEAAEIRVKLARYYSRANRIYAEADFNYRKKLKEISGRTENNKRISSTLAEIEANATEEYRLYREAEREVKSLEKMITSVDSFVRTNLFDFRQNK